MDLFTCDIHGVDYIDLQMVRVFIFATASRREMTISNWPSIAAITRTRGLISELRQPAAATLAWLEPCLEQDERGVAHFYPHRGQDQRLRQAATSEPRLGLPGCSVQLALNTLFLIDIVLRFARVYSSFCFDQPSSVTSA